MPDKKLLLNFTRSIQVVTGLIVLKIEKYHIIIYYNRKDHYTEHTKVYKGFDIDFKEAPEKLDLSFKMKTPT